MTTPVPHFSQEIRTTLTLAAPLALAQLAQMGMGLTDTIMLGALGRDALAAGGLGAGLFFTITTVLQGLVFGVGILLVALFLLRNVIPFYGTLWILLFVFVICFIWA